MIDIEKILISKKKINSTLKLLKKYHDYLNVFSQKDANKLFKHQSYNHKINLKFDKQSTFDSLYKMSLNEFKCLKKYLNEHLSKEFIHVNSLFAIASVLFVKKLEDDLHFYMNYQVLNKITIKNCYSIFLI